MELTKAKKLFESFQKISSDFKLAGSARRGKQSGLHDLDLIYIGKEIPTNLPGFEYNVVGDRIVRGKYQGELIDIYRCEAEEYGAMLLYLTGPKMYNIKMRAKAKHKGFKLNQYGLFNLDGKRIVSKTEEAIYQTMGFAFKDPALRGV